MIDVLTASLQLHMAATGSSDESRVVLDELAKQLRERVEHWKPGIPSSAAFDRTVLLLCEIALVEYAS